MDQSWLRAIEKDNAIDLTAAVENHPLQVAEIRWDDNPMLTVCERVSVNCAREILRRYPELAWLRSQDGSSFMHYVCENGHVAVFRTLLGVPQVHPQRLCALKDGQGRTPLHVATIAGHEEVVRELITFRPKSIHQSTGLQETAFHLALKHDHCSSFLVLMDHLRKLNCHHFLNFKDSDGNTVLHIVIARKKIQILKMLLTNEGPNAGPIVQVNIKNNRGLTALDLHYQNFCGRTDLDITDLLLRAGAKEGHSFHMCEQQPDSPGITNKVARDSMIKSSFLAVFILIAGVAYSCLFNLDIDSKKRHAHDDELATLSVTKMVMHSHLLPDCFLFLMFNTVTFLGSMVVILINTWTLVDEWSFCYRGVPLLIMLPLSISYALIVKMIMPKFWVTVGDYKLSSFWFVWACDLPLVLSIVALWLVVKQIVCIFFTQERRCGHLNHLLYLLDHKIS